MENKKSRILILNNKILALFIGLFVFIITSLIILINDLLNSPFKKIKKQKKDLFQGDSFPIISAVIPNWNGKTFLKECLDSLLNQTFKDYELILVDNGSNDGSVEFIKNNYPMVKILAQPTNRGVAAGLNIGIRESKGKYIALFNNDIVVDRHWMSKMYRILEENNDVGFCASKMLFYIQPDIINAAGDNFTNYGESINIGFKEKDCSQYNISRYVFSACAGAAIYRRAMLEEIGLFDEDFITIYEDIDLGFRAQWRGWKCFYVSEAAVYHHGSATIGYSSPMHIFYLNRNNLNLIIKNLPLKLLLKYFYRFLIKQLKLSVQFGVNGSFIAFTKGKLCTLGQILCMLKKRNEILSNRKVDSIDRYWYV